MTDAFNLVDEIVKQSDFCIDKLLTLPADEKNHWDMKYFRSDASELDRLIAGRDIVRGAENTFNFVGMDAVALLSRIVSGKNYIFGDIVIRHFYAMYNEKERDGEVIHAGLYVMNYTGSPKSRDEIDAYLTTMKDKAPVVFASLFAAPRWQLFLPAELDRSVINPENDDCFYCFWALNKEAENTHKVFMGDFQGMPICEIEIFLRCVLYIAGIKTTRVDSPSRGRIAVTVPLADVEKGLQVFGLVNKLAN